MKQEATDWKNTVKNAVLLLLILFFITPNNSLKCKSLRERIDLSGTWQFSIDTVLSDPTHHWFIDDKLDDTIILPGTMDENKKGLINHDTTDYHLNRKYIYTGAAWYQRKVEIPSNWKDKHIELFLERTKVTTLWIDTSFVGINSSIFTPQVYNLSKFLTPGSHIITILVDNTESLLPIAGSHAYSEDTQTNWNGIIGDIHLEAAEFSRIKNVISFPDIINKSIKLKISLAIGKGSINKVSISINGEAFNSESDNSVPEKIFHAAQITTDTTLELVYNLGKDALFWSEFNPALYHISIILSSDNNRLDDYNFDLGLREFKTKGTQFTINGVTTFLRGEHNACVFPLTGHPPMDVDGWLKVFNTAKEYGINHYRFHTWTPPEAAFKAADIAGIYLQPELPVWWAFNPNDSTQMKFIIKLGKDILKCYANHPSFVMFSLGNEIPIDRSHLKYLVDEFRKNESRPLYSQGSNNRLWDPSYAAGDDYWTTARTGKESVDLGTDIRASFSHLDSKHGGLLNTIYPNTTFNYSKAILNSPVPIIGHEIGQYQTYPNFSAELPKYTGILEPRNLEVFKYKLAKAGMADQAEDFFHASGALSTLCYKAEIETALRTPGFGGFQLLDLQDYPGQGTALVGILDAFMESKDLISPKDFRKFCDKTVVLLEMDKYCWWSDEQFTAKIKIVNYDQNDLKDKVITWQIIGEDDSRVIGQGELPPKEFRQGTLSEAGNITLQLPAVNKAEKLKVKIDVKDYHASNEYPLWVYPSKQTEESSNDILISSKLDSTALSRLNSGGSVLLVPSLESIKQKSIPGQFISEFWNYKMFKELAQQYGGQESPGTLGILTSPRYPLFNNFPTEFYTNWQWWIIIKNSRSVILDKAPAGYKPIIQVIDNIDRNHKLGMLFEFRIGNGKVLVCPVNLEAIKEKPEGCQFKKALIDYIKSNSFNPSTLITVNELNDLLF